MKKTITITFLTFLFITQVEVNSQSESSKIDPHLQIVLLEASNHQMIDVYAVFKEQYSIKTIKQQTSHLSRKEKQNEVVRILKDFTDTEQQAVRNFLEEARQQNLVNRMDILWAANTIVFTAVPAVIYELAENFDEIAEIRFEVKFDESMLIDITEPSLPVSSLGESYNPAPQAGLTLINAPAVWAAGDSGAGVLVASLDTGCDWDHPDLINNIYQNG